MSNCVSASIPTADNGVHPAAAPARQAGDPAPTPQVQPAGMPAADDAPTGDDLNLRETA